jgi:DNA-binding XRE family transcriptional regulator
MPVPDIKSYDRLQQDIAIPAIYKNISDQLPVENNRTSPYMRGSRYGTVLGLFMLAPEKTRPPSLNPSDQVASIEKAFGLNRSQLANVLKTTRKTIYDWDKGAELTKREIITRLFTLSEIAQSFTDDGMGLYIGKNIRRPVLGRVSLLDLLSKSEFDKEAINKAMKAIKPLAEASKNRIESMKARNIPQLSESEAQATLDHFAPRI